MPDKKTFEAVPRRLPETEPPPPPEAFHAPILPPQPIVSLAPTKTPKEWAKEKATPDWHLAAAAAGEAWSTDKILSEQAFDEAIHRALGAQAG